MTLPRYELFFAVRPPVIARFCGQFLLVTAALNLVTLIVALLFSEFDIALSYAVMIAVLSVCGALLARISTTDEMQLNEALVLIALIFLMVPLVAALPLIIHGTAPADAVFETISAATTTGLSTLGPIENRPETFRFARAWMQWYGGLGIVVFSLALIVRPGMSALRLASLDSPDDLVGGTRAHARRVLYIYAALTGSGLLLWVLLGGAPYQGLLYIFSAVSTGGFSPGSGSFADLPGLSLPWVVTIASLAGAVPLALYHQAWRKGAREFFANREFIALIFTGLLLTTLLGATLWQQGMSFTEVFHHAPLMSLSAQTTAGFSSMAPADMSPAGKAVMILTMLIGGGIGSTAGGVKMLRVLLLFGLIYHSLKRICVPPDTVLSQRLGKRRVAASDVQDALMIIMLFLGVVGLSWLCFLAYGFDPTNALFEVVSATGTVGLSSGVTAASLPVFLKLVLCADMLLGRLEFVAWLVFFYHRTWFGRKRGWT